jgi:hypothetical protein
MRTVSRPWPLGTARPLPDAPFGSDIRRACCRASPIPTTTAPTTDTTRGYRWSTMTLYLKALGMNVRGQEKPLQPQLCTDGVSPIATLRQGSLHQEQTKGLFAGGRTNTGACDRSKISLRHLGGGGREKCPCSIWVDVRTRHLYCRCSLVGTGFFGGRKCEQQAPVICSRCSQRQSPMFAGAPRQGAGAGA